MVKYTCLYYSLIQSGLEFSCEGRGRAPGAGKFSPLFFFPGVTAPENWGYVAVAAARPGPQPFRRRSAARGEAGSGGPGPDPGSGPTEGEEREGEGGGGGDLPVPSPLAGAPVRNSISIFYEE